MPDTEYSAAASQCRLKDAGTGHSALLWQLQPHGQRYAGLAVQSQLSSVKKTQWRQNLS